MSNQPDNSINKLLAALNATALPDGLEARITQRLAQAPAPTHHEPSRWHNLLVSTGSAGTFWRGAATGAAFALLAVAAVILFRHQTAPHVDTAATHHSAPTAVSLKVAGSLAVPCPQPAALHSHPSYLARPHATTLFAANRRKSEAPSHPAPALPLTAQERDLLRLAHTANPQQLTTVNPESQARLMAQQAADFDRFFTPPPAPSIQTEE